MRGETIKQFLPRGAEGRTIGIGNHILHRKELPLWTQPTENTLDVEIALGGIDGAEQSVLEKPVEGRRWRVAKEIGLLKLRFQTGGGGALAGKADGAGGEIESGGAKAGPCPHADIVSRSATWYTDGTAR